MHYTSQTPKPQTKHPFSPQKKTSLPIDRIHFDPQQISPQKQPKNSISTCARARQSNYWLNSSWLTSEYLLAQSPQPAEGHLKLRIAARTRQTRDECLQPQLGVEQLALIDHNFSWDENGIRTIRSQWTDLSWGDSLSQSVSLHG